MRKIFFTLILSTAVITASFHAQVKRFVIKERKTDKSLNIALSATNNYGSNTYRFCEAKLEYNILKIRGRQIDTVIQKQVPKFKLNELPLIANAFNENITIKDVVDRKEQIVISYTITYISKGSTLKVGHEKFVAKNQTADSLKINI